MGPQWIIFFIALSFSATARATHFDPNGVPLVRNLSEVDEDSTTIPGISHITVAGAVLYHFKEIEVWMETAAPGAHTPVHRHDCEEVFVVLKGSGTIYLASNSDGEDKYPGTPKEIPFYTNSTFHITPNDVHQVMNTNKHEDLHLIVIISKPPMKVVIYDDWSSPHTSAKPMHPFIWDVKYYNKQESTQDEL